MAHPPTMEVEVNGIIDLHAFHPREVPDLVQEYLRECRLRGIHEVRIIHGKGKGVLRKRVQTLLAQHPDVISFGPAQDRSGWGATVVLLRNRKPPRPDPSLSVPEKSSTFAILLRRLWPWRD